MQFEKAKQIYDFCREENIDAYFILGLEGLSKEEYQEAINIYLKSLPVKEITMGYEDDEPYKEFQQANFDEYFDWAATYRYALWK